MATIIPKLNLNKTPNLVENNSLVFAKNIRLDVDGTIHRDYGITPLSFYENINENKIINYNDLLNRIINDIKHSISIIETDTDYIIKNYGNIFNPNSKTLNVNMTWIDDVLQKLENVTNYKIVGTICDSNAVYIFIYCYDYSFIIKYDEKKDVFEPCNCNWNWNKGIVEGVVIKNLIGDTIINVIEHTTNTIVPFKSINLNKSSIYDDESVYTQTPNIPITNLNVIDKFNYVVPNGVYQFFIRYKIRENFYTNWFVASKEIFIGNKESTVTSFGSLSYINTHRDSDNSIIFAVEHMNVDYNKLYESFQIGFILSHDDAIYARAWKHFQLNISTINFDYNSTDAIEIEVTDLLKVTYGLYNVKNITSFKNKLYISNYTETDFNTNLQKVADEVTMTKFINRGGDTYYNYPILTTSINDETFISGINVDGDDKYFSNTSTSNGIFYEIISYKDVAYGVSIIDLLKKVLDNNPSVNTHTNSKYGITISPSFDRLNNRQNEIRKKYSESNIPGLGITRFVVNFNDTITGYKIGNNSIVNIPTGITSSNIDIFINAICASRYLNSNCRWVDINNNNADALTIELYRQYTVVKYFTPENSSEVEVYPAETLRYAQRLTFSYIANSGSLQFNNDVSNLINYTTLIPYQKYKFYIHFVKQNGEITNGFYCSKIGNYEVPYEANANGIIYPKFEHIEIPEGYAACFFSILHTENNVSTIFNITDDDTKILKEASCFDFNMMLTPSYERIYIRQGVIEKTLANGVTTYTQVETRTGKYYYSSDQAVIKYFGADGVVTFNNTNFNNDKVAYAISAYKISEHDDIQLIKCTPYISNKNLFNEIDSSGNTIKTYSDYTNMNLIGYLCNVAPLDRSRCINYYTDGSSIYKKEFAVNSDIINLNLTELSKYTNADDDKRLALFGLIVTNNVSIYSNYNLNYISLTEDIKFTIKTAYNRASNDTGSATEKELNDTKNIVLKLISSQLMSGVYTLPSMYKSYTRKIFSIYNTTDTNRFDNTIKSSVSFGDESEVNLLKFDADDYYNVPINRGLITNLIAIGDAILVHTQDSLFKFTGSNNLQSNNGEIQPTETEPFNTGITEIFGSDFGFAGLQSKTDSITTEQGYIFFDRDSRIVYMWTGQSNIIKLNEYIEKLFRHRNISNVYFANDFYNNRFFMSILFYDTYYKDNTLKYKYYPITLSFNFSEVSKSFVSLHDFYYNKAFNTKTKCYFLTEDNKDVCTINKKYKGIYTKLNINSDKIYPSKYTTKSIIVVDENGNEISYDTNQYYSIIDIINNTNFENIKTLNSVSWCGNIVNAEFTDINTSDESTLKMTEDVVIEYPCDYFRIYTDSCMTKLLDFKNRSNDKSIDTTESYKYPRYNQGYWSTNYFRNILNANNKNNYYVSDENSLIEGKYFVVRFLFSEDFKLETVSLNYSTKL